MKAAELEGQRFGLLTVLERDGSKNNKAMWKCRCDCGTICRIPTGDLHSGNRTSCGCIKKMHGQQKTIDETGNRYGFLTVVKQVGSNKERKALWLCRCDCGNMTITTGKCLRKGHTRSCGCLARKITSENSLHDLTGERFGMLTVIERAPTRYSKLGNPTTRWLCKCDCGRMKDIAANALTAGHTRSCGCMKTSFREKEICRLFNNIHLNYIKEYSFEDLLSPSGNQLRFDFAILDQSGTLVCLIEHQGEQHYFEYSNGFGQMQREISDPLKKEFCKVNHIPLYEIRYDDDIMARVKEILTEINASHVNLCAKPETPEGATTIS